MMSERTGRRRGESGTREAILRAAQVLFAERGYRGATLRAVAAAAGVDVALVSHYFGSKEGLFRAAVAPPLDPEAVVKAATEGPMDEAGLRVARLAVGMLERPATRRTLVAILRTSTADEQAAAMLRDVVGRRVYGPVAERLGGEAADVRATLVGSQILGLAMARHVVRLEPLASLPAEDLVRWLAPTLQAYLTGPLPSADGSADRQPGWPIGHEPGEMGPAAPEGSADRQPGWPSGHRAAGEEGA